MKYILILALLFTGCVTTDVKPDSPKVPEVVAPVEQPSKPIESVSLLAWGDQKPSWDVALYSEIAKHDWSSVKVPCKQYSKEHCVGQLISIMAKYESSFKPEVTYKEGFNDSKGKPVISRGLLQLSIESANQKAYGCEIEQASDLHDPAINLRCAVRIVAFQAKKSKTLMGEPKLGCAAYWSVCRKSSGSNAKILKYMEQF
jgi:hypothetical protein